MHTASTSKLLAPIGIAALLLLWMSLLPSAYAGQATDPAPLSAIQQRGDSRPAALNTPTAVYRTYLPLVVKNQAPPATPTPTRTPAPTPTAVPGNEGALFMDTISKTNGAKVAVDPAGGIHMTYLGSELAYYSYCAASCGSISSWASISFNFGNMYQYVELQLTTTGHPRLLILGWDASYATHYWYASCNAGCAASAANWTTNLVVDTKHTDITLQDYSYFTFALDPQDRPRFIYQKLMGSTAYYVFCDDADCAPPTALWYELKLSDDIFDRPSLSFTGGGSPRLATLVFSDNPAVSGFLRYGGCDADCTNPANWWYVSLYMNSHSYRLRLTTSDQPRIAFYMGTVSTGLLYYVACDTNCQNVANWGGWGVGGLAAGNGQTPDLVLDGSNRPRIAYRQGSPEGLGYAWCTANCETGSATWYTGLAESGADLDAEWDILPPLNCDNSAWYAGYRPSITLDAGGNPRIGSEGVHLHGGRCLVAEDFRAARVTFFNQP